MVILTHMTVPLVSMCLYDFPEPLGKQADLGVHLGSQTDKSDGARIIMAKNIRVINHG